MIGWAKGVAHAKNKPPYSPEFRQQILDLVQAGLTPNDLAHEFEPSGETIRQWVKQAARVVGEHTNGLATDRRPN